MRAAIDAEAAGFPDLLACSSELLGEALGELPGWAWPLGFADYFGIRHQGSRLGCRPECGEAGHHPARSPAELDLAPPWIGAASRCSAH